MKRLFLVTLVWRPAHSWLYPENLTTTTGLSVQTVPAAPLKVE